MLSQIVADAYAIFQCEKPSLPLDVCTDCCMQISDTERLISLPLPSISHTLLAEYTNSAKPDLTRNAEMRYFLPRYLDLIAQSNIPSHSIELSFSRLCPFQVQDWKPAELALLQEFGLAYFKKQVNQYDSEHFQEPLINILIMLMGMDGSLYKVFQIDACLAYWFNNQSLASVMHYRDAYWYGFKSPRSVQLQNPFATGLHSEVLHTWVFAEDTQKQFAEAIEQIVVSAVQPLEEADAYDLSCLYEQLKSAYSA